MKELNLEGLISYRKALENTWRNYVGEKDNLSCSVIVFEHLQKRYRNVCKIIRKRKETVNFQNGTYHVEVENGR